jgi:hypothetical protein
MGGRAQLLLPQLLLIQRLRLLLFVLRERLLVGQAVLLYLGHKVNNYPPIEQINFRVRSKMEAGTSLSLSLALCPENFYL